jgi:hypothetical protein
MSKVIEIFECAGDNICCMNIKLPQNQELVRRLKTAMKSSYLRSLPQEERQRWVKAARECRTLDDLSEQMRIHLLRSEEELSDVTDVTHSNGK